MATQFGFYAQMMLFATEKQRTAGDALIDFINMIQKIKQRDLLKELADKKEALEGEKTTLEGQIDAESDEKKKKKLQKKLKIVKIKLNAENELPIVKIEIEAMRTKLDSAKIEAAKEAINATLSTGDANTETDKFKANTEAYKADAEKESDFTGAFDKLMKKIDLNMVMVEKNPYEGKVGLPPGKTITIKQETFCNGVGITDESTKSLVPDTIEISRLSIDLDDKTSMFAANIKPGDEFILNKKADLFYLNQAGVTFIRSLDDEE